MTCLSIKHSNFEPAAHHARLATGDVTPAVWQCDSLRRRGAGYSERVFVASVSGDPAPLCVCPVAHFLLERTRAAADRRHPALVIGGGRRG